MHSNVGTIRNILDGDVWKWSPRTRAETLLMIQQLVEKTPDKSDEQKQEVFEESVTSLQAAMRGASRDTASDDDYDQMVIQAIRDGKVKNVTFNYE